MGRLGILIVVLAVVVAAAVVVQMRVAPTIALSSMAAEAPKRLSKADEKKLEAAKARFAKERDRFLQMRSAGAPEAELAAQNAKAAEAAKVVVSLGGTMALKSVGKSKYASLPSPGSGAKGQTSKPGEASKSGAAGSSCSGEAGGSCSGEGGTCSPTLSDKPGEKASRNDAKAGGPTKTDTAAKPASKK